MSQISHTKGNKIVKVRLELKRPHNEACLKNAQDTHACMEPSQQMYRDLVEMAHEGITMVDPHENLTFVNKQFAKSLGYKVNELIGRSLFTLSTKASAARMKKGTEMRRRGLKSRYEVILFHQDGSKKCFWLSASPIYGPSREFVGSMGVYSDLTEKKAMELRIKRKISQIDTLYKVYEHARMAKPLNVVLNGITQEVCRAFPFAQYVQAKLVFDQKAYTYPRKLKRFVHKIEIPLEIAGFRRGTLKVGYNKSFPHLAQGDGLVGEQKLVRNVADILCKHMYARGVLDRHREIIQKAFTAIIIVSNQKITYVNPRFNRIFKCKQEQAIGQKIRKFLPNCIGQSGIERGIKECVGKTLTGVDVDLAMITQNINYHGKVSTLIRVNDISALKKAQAKLSNFNQELKKTVNEKTLHLEEANKRLQSINQLKDEFIAITSHELRSPLTSIRGYLSFLVEDESISQISEPYREYLIRAYSTTDALNYLINNILDVSRLDMGRFQLQKQGTDVIKLMRNILDSLSFQMGERRLEFEFDNQTGQDQLILSIDSIRMSQVLRNILDNSIKFTKRGKKIKVTLKYRDKNRGLCISVADQGVGIPKAKLDLIFDKFMQVKNTHTKYKGGVGLGLFIAKRIIELHQGQIQANKNEDGGTTVSIHLPLDH